MKNYELVCILDPQFGDRYFDETIERYENHLKSNGAEIANIDRWGLRKLAYTSISLKKRRQGYYVLFQFAAESELIIPLEQQLKLDEGVLRHLVVAVKGDFLRVPQLLSEDTVLGEMSPRRDRDERRPPPRAAREVEEEDAKVEPDGEEAVPAAIAAEEADAKVEEEDA